MTTIKKNQLTINAGKVVGKQEFSDTTMSIQIGVARLEISIENLRKA